MTGLGITTTQLALMRKQVRSLLPSVCNVGRRSITNDAGGLWDESATNVSYESSTNIPCRVDPLRTHRDGSIVNQEILINDYVITLPYDFRIELNDLITYDGRSFQVRKLMQGHSWNVSSRAFLTELDRT